MAKFTWHLISNYWNIIDRPYRSLLSLSFWLDPIWWIFPPHTMKVAPFQRSLLYQPNIRHDSWRHHRVVGHFCPLVQCFYWNSITTEPIEWSSPILFWLSWNETRFLTAVTDVGPLRSITRTQFATEPTWTQSAPDLKVTPSLLMVTPFYPIWPSLVSTV